MPKSLRMPNEWLAGTEERLVEEIPEWKSKFDVVRLGSHSSGSLNDKGIDEMQYRTRLLQP